MKKKNTEATVEQPIPSTEVETTVEQSGQPKVDERIEHLMKCYPQYENMYISPQGFVYPENAPEYQRKDAILYHNIHYQK